MKKLLLVVALLALVVSPFIVTQADAAPTRDRHNAVTRHHRKQLRKHSVKRSARRHRSKVAV
jgi:Ni/Co efflux regulator RcnB